MHCSVTLYHTIISKFQKLKNFKNSPIVKKSISQVTDIMLDACMQFENNSIKILGEEAFTETIYYTIISKYQKFAKISKIVLSSKSTSKETYHI